MRERWEMELNHATGRYEIGTPDAIPYCQFAEVNGEQRARLMTSAHELLDLVISFQERFKEWQISGQPKYMDFLAIFEDSQITTSKIEGV